MKKLSLILVLIMTLSLMVGALTTIAFAAGDGTEANPITVGGEGADYATVAEALAAIGTAEGTTYIKVTGNTTETAAGIVLANDVVIYSDATGDARPVITLAADANIGAASGYYFWIKVNGAALTFDGVQINTSPFVTAKDASKATGSVILDNGAKVSLIDSTADHGGSKTKNGGFVYLAEATHSGDFIMDNSTVTSANRAIYIEKSTGSSSITLLNNSKLASTVTHGIQCSATTPAALAVTVVDSEISANGVGMYNRATKAEVTLVNATITSTSQVVDARNDKATLDLVVVGGTFNGVDLVKFKSVKAVIDIIGADLTGVTSAIVNNELSSEDIAVSTYGVTYGKCTTFTNVPAEKNVELDKAGLIALLEVAYANNPAVKEALSFIIDGWKYDEASKTYTIVTADGYIAAVNHINANKNGAATIELAANIDFAGKEVPVICLDNTANGYFSGTFNGNGYTMSNIVIDKSGTDRVGIVGQSAGGTFKNVTIENASVKAKTYVSLFIGDARSGSATVTFENCIVKNAKVEATDSYPAIFVTTNQSPVVIKNCMVLDAQIVAAGNHAGILFNDRGATVDLAITVENVVMTGTVSAKTNAGAIGYMCDSKLTLTNVISFVEAKKAANASALVSNAKRSSVIMNNVITVGTPIAIAEALGEKADNNFVLNNVYVLGNADAKVFKNAVINGTKAATLTINGTAADFATATITAIPTNTADAAAAKIAEIFADNAALKDAATAAIPHFCIFDQEAVDNKFLATEATCIAQATYYKSCVCGEKGTETFAAGEVLPHVFDQEMAGDEYLVSDATCTTGAVFYKSCECGLKGEETFMSIGSLGHLFGEWTTVTEPTVDAEGVKERECSACGEKETKSIEKLPAPEAPAEEPSIVDQIKDKVVGVKDMVAGKLGCGGSIGGASIIIMIAAAGAVVLRKKED